MALGDLIAGIGNKLGLPEYGISEMFGGGMDKYKQQSSGYNIPGSTYGPAVKGTSSGPVQGPPGPPSGYYSGGGGSSSQNPSALDQISNNTRDLYREQLDHENSLYDHWASELNNQLGGLEREKDSMLDRIGSTYRGLVDTANQTLTKNLGLLEGRKGEVQQEYDTGRTNAARLLGDEQRMNRQLARAQNLLSSGYYTNLQSQAGRTATERIAGLNTEEQSKLDAIGTSILNAQTDTNTKILALQEEQAMQEGEVRNKYSTLANAIRNDLRFNARDRVDALKAVNRRMESALDGVNMAFLQYQTMAGNLGTTATQQTASITGYDPFAAIQTTLNTRNAQDAAYQPVTSALADGGGATASNPIGYYNFNNQPRSRLDELFA